MTTTASPVPTSDRELVLTRVIRAPREKVFKAWTDPELLEKWFAPQPYTKVGVSAQTSLRRLSRKCD